MGASSTHVLVVTYSAVLTFTSYGEVLSTSQHGAGVSIQHV